MINDDKYSIKLPIYKVLLEHVLPSIIPSSFVFCLFLSERSALREPRGRLQGVRGQEHSVMRLTWFRRWSRCGRCEMVFGHPPGGCGHAPGKKCFFLGHARHPLANAVLEKDPEPRRQRRPSKERGRIWPPKSRF